MSSETIAVVSGFSKVKVAVRLVSTLTLIWLLDGCSPSEPKPKSQLEIQTAKEKDMKWQMATLRGEYERVGSKDPKWDEDAKAGLEMVAGMGTDDLAERQKDWERIGRAMDSAVRAGCPDPLVRYFYLRSAYANEQHGTNEIVDAYQRVAADLESSGYCEIRKFWACLRAAQEIKRANRTSDAIYIQRRNAIGHIAPALEDKDLPPKQALDACRELLVATQADPQDLPDAYNMMEAPLSKHFSKTAVPNAIKGVYYLDYAWQARGGGYADSVTPERWKLFGERLDTAAAALEKAWRIDPSEPFTAITMIRVELGQGKGRDRMELWFRRAMNADSNSLEACQAKLLYLEPKWHGSYQAMVEFGRQCTTNEAWGGFVTSFIADVHQSIANSSREGASYWKRPGVWEDIRAGFEEFFRRNPDAVAAHYNYAWYAYACGAWDVVAQQLPLLSEPIDVNYFGGLEAFEEMRKQAKLHTKK